MSLLSTYTCSTCGRTYYWDDYDRWHDEEACQREADARDAESDESIGGYNGSFWNMLETWGLIGLAVFLIGMLIALWNGLIMGKEWLGNLISHPSWYLDIDSELLWVNAGIIIAAVGAILALGDWLRERYFFRLKYIFFYRRKKKV